LYVEAVLFLGYISVFIFRLCFRKKKETDQYTGLQVEVIEWGEAECHQKEAAIWLGTRIGCEKLKLGFAWFVPIFTIAVVVSGCLS
jgi:hypothetical protein